MRPSPTLSRRRLVAALGAAALPVRSFAQAPANALRIVVGYPAGQSTDAIARAFAAALQRDMGVPVIVDNKAGANGIVGAQEVKRAASDGKTILFGTSGQLAINMSLYRKLPYDSLKDFAPVAMIAQGALVLVATPSFPPNTVQELIAYAKARPGQVNYGSGGQGITGHLGMEILQDAAKIKLQHIPYKGSPAALTDVMAGTVALALDPTVSAIPHVKSGRLKALGITGPQRNPQLPEVPTLAEQGLRGFEVTSWAAVVAPAGTPDATVQALNAALARAAQSKEVTELMRANGIETSIDTPARLGTYLQAEVRKWGKAVADSGVQLDN